MSVTTTRVPDVIGYLVTECTASALLGASPTAPVRVIDGPPVTGDELAEQRLLYIGWDAVNGNPAGGTEVANAAQVWPFGDKARTRDEDATVVCTADAWTGSTVTQDARNACYAIVQGVDTLLRGDPDAGGPGDASMGGLVFWSAPDSFAWYPRQTPNGAGWACVFHVSYHARLLAS